MADDEEEDGDFSDQDRRGGAHRRSSSDGDDDDEDEAPRKVKAAAEASTPRRVQIGGVTKMVIEEDDHHHDGSEEMDKGKPSKKQDEEEEDEDDEEVPTIASSAMAGWFTDAKDEDQTDSKERPQRGSKDKNEEDEEDDEHVPAIASSAMAGWFQETKAGEADEPDRGQDVKEDDDDGDDEEGKDKGKVQSNDTIVQGEKEEEAAKKGADPKQAEEDEEEQPGQKSEEQEGAQSKDNNKDQVKDKDKNQEKPQAQAPAAAAKSGTSTSKASPKAKGKSKATPERSASPKAKDRGASSPPKAKEKAKPKEVPAKSSPMKPSAKAPAPPTSSKTAAAAGAPPAAPVAQTAPTSSTSPTAAPAAPPPAPETAAVSGSANLGDATEATPAVEAQGVEEEADEFAPRVVDVPKEVSKLGLRFDPGPPERTFVSTVKNGSWAESAGFDEGEEIVSVNGVAISQFTSSDFDRAIAARPLRLVVLPVFERIVEVETNVKKLGLHFSPKPPNRTFVDKLQPGSWAEEVGFEVGVEIIAVDDLLCTDMASADELTAALNNRPLQLMVSFADLKGRGRVVDEVAGGDVTLSPEELQAAMAAAAASSPATAAPPLPPPATSSTSRTPGGGGGAHSSTSGVAPRSHRPFGSAGAGAGAGGKAVGSSSAPSTAREGAATGVTQPGNLKMQKSQLGRTVPAGTVPGASASRARLRMRRMKEDYAMNVKALNTKGRSPSRSPSPKRDGGFDGSDDHFGVWRVVSTLREPVLTKKTLAAQVIGRKKCEELVVGRREGNWIRLQGEPGYMMLVSNTSGEQLLRLARRLASPGGARSPPRSPNSPQLRRSLSPTSPNARKFGTASTSRWPERHKNRWRHRTQERDTMHRRAMVKRWREQQRQAPPLKRTTRPDFAEAPAWRPARTGPDLFSEPERVGSRPSRSSSPARSSSPGRKVGGNLRKMSPPTSVKSPHYLMPRFLQSRSPSNSEWNHSRSPPQRGRAQARSPSPSSSSSSPRQRYERFRSPLREYSPGRRYVPALPSPSHRSPLRKHLLDAAADAAAGRSRSPPDEFGYRVPASSFPGRDLPPSRNPPSSRSPNRYNSSNRDNRSFGNSNRSSSRRSPSPPPQTPTTSKVAAAAPRWRNGSSSGGTRGRLASSETMRSGVQAAPRPVNGADRWGRRSPSPSPSSPPLKSSSRPGRVGGGGGGGGGGSLSARSQSAASARSTGLQDAPRSANGRDLSSTGSARNCSPKLERPRGGSSSAWVVPMGGGRRRPDSLPHSNSGYFSAVGRGGGAGAWPRSDSRRRSNNGSRSNSPTGQRSPSPSQAQGPTRSPGGGSATAARAAQSAQARRERMGQGAFPSRSGGGGRKPNLARSASSRGRSPASSRSGSPPPRYGSRKIELDDMMPPPWKHSKRGERAWAEAAPSLNDSLSSRLKTISRVRKTRPGPGGGGGAPDDPGRPRRWSPQQNAAAASSSRLNRSSYAQGRGWSTSIPSVERSEESRRAQAHAARVSAATRREARSGSSGRGLDTPRFGEQQQQQKQQQQQQQQQRSQQMMKMKQKAGPGNGNDATNESGRASSSREGLATLHFDGGSFEGEWLHGVASGQGSVYFKNGDWFSGDYHNNRKHGHGVYHWADGGWEEGTYYKGKKEGWHRWYACGELWDLEYRAGVMKQACKVADRAFGLRPGESYEDTDEGYFNKDISRT